MSIDFHVFVFSRREREYNVSHLSSSGCMRNSFQETKIPTVSQRDLGLFRINSCASTSLCVCRCVCEFESVSNVNGMPDDMHALKVAFIFSMSRGWESVRLMQCNLALPSNQLQSGWYTHTLTNTHAHTFTFTEKGVSGVFEILNFVPFYLLLLGLHFSFF